MTARTPFGMIPHAGVGQQRGDAVSAPIPLSGAPGRDPAHQYSESIRTPLWDVQRTNYPFPETSNRNLRCAALVMYGVFLSFDGTPLPLDNVHLTSLRQNTHSLTVPGFPLRSR